MDTAMDIWRPCCSRHPLGRTWNALHGYLQGSPKARSILPPCGKKLPQEDLTFPVLSHTQTSPEGTPPANCSTERGQWWKTKLRNACWRRHCQQTVNQSLLRTAHKSHGWTQRWSQKVPGGPRATSLGFLLLYVLTLWHVPPKCYHKVPPRLLSNYCFKHQKYNCITPSWVTRSSWILLTENSELSEGKDQLMSQPLGGKSFLPQISLR